MSKRGAAGQVDKKMEELDHKIDNIVRNFSYVNYGDDYDTSDTWQAARDLEMLPIFEVGEEITNAEISPQAKWTLAIKLTKEVSKMLVQAEFGAGPHVDGTRGYFCPAAASEIVELWRYLCDYNSTAEVKIDEEFTDQITVDFEKSLGKYGDLSFIKTNPDALPEPRVLHACPDGNADA